jgi:hypothetical protein
MACPFFVPTLKCEDSLWIHPSRLPLGAGWQGYCSAPGHEGDLPSNCEIRDWCNLGYAAACPRLPRERRSDAVRFAIARDGGDRLVVWCIGEAAHRPVDHAMLEYDVLRHDWVVPHPDPRTQKLAECYLESYLVRRTAPPPDRVAPSANP